LATKASLQNGWDKNADLFLVLKRRGFSRAVTAVKKDPARSRHEKPAREALFGQTVRFAAERQPLFSTEVFLEQALAVARCLTNPRKSVAASFSQVYNFTF
jgi:hypothetical protein